MGFVMMYIYLPVFHDLKLTSTYQVRTNLIHRPHLRIKFRLFLIAFSVSPGSVRQENAPVWLYSFHLLASMKY